MGRLDWLSMLIWAVTVAVLALSVTWSGNASAMDATLMVDIIACESSGRHDAIGDDGTSVGIAQFQKATFNEMKAKAGMPKLRWKNPVHQMRLMIWMIDHGYGKRWTCFRKLKGEK